MTSILLKMKGRMFFIAISIFLFSFVTIFYLVNGNKIYAENEHISANVLKEESHNGTNLTQLIDELGNSFLILNKDFNIDFTGEDTQTDLGYPEEELNDQNFLDLIHTDDLPYIINTIVKASEEKPEENIVGPIRIKTNTNEYQPYMANIVPLEDEEDNMAVTLIDVSEPFAEDKKAIITEENDKDNGHGNDENKIDHSNPGKSIDHKEEKSNNNKNK